MGWLAYDIYTSPKEEYDRILKRENEDVKQQVLASCMKGNVYYAALQVENKKESGKQVVGVVFLTNYSPRAKKGFNFAIKEMTENMEPYYYDFPEKYFNLLTPTENSFAIRWREKVRDKINHRKRLSKLKNGDKIKIICPYDTTSGVKRGEEIILKKEKRYFSYKGLWKWSLSQIPTNFEIIKED